MLTTSNQSIIPSVRKKLMMKSVLILDEFFAMTAKIRTLFLSHIKITNYLTLKHGTFKLRRFLLFHKTSFAHVPNRQGAPHGGNTSVDGSFCYRPSIQLPCIRAGADRQSFVSEILHGSKRRVRGCFGYYRPLSTTLHIYPLRIFPGLSLMGMVVSSMCSTDDSITLFI